MTNKTKHIISTISILFVGFVVGFISQPQTIANGVVEHRTDTITIVQPAIERVDTFYKEVRVPVKVAHTERDTIIRVDSVMVYLPYERKVYKDSTYRAVVSGYEPVLEQIDVYARETTIYKEKTPSRLSPFVMGGLGSKGSVSIGGGIFIKDRNAFALELETRGKTKDDLQLEVKYIHKF